MLDSKALAAIPEADVATSPAIERGVADSVAYLASDAAIRSIEIDTYWPKWDSSWWHMLLLFELGEARKIPARAVEEMVAGLEALPLHIYPIHPGEAPPDIDRHRDISCHCALGCMAQVLTACGVDVDRALPWVTPWFVRYQMADGGLNCDDTAYLAKDECPSSMVGTIAPFEAMLGKTWTGDRASFVERAARFLIGRALTRGSDTVHNAEEREAAVSWRSPCFPRFYFYDVLRGLAALVKWAEASGEPLPSAAIEPAVEVLSAEAPDGIVRVARRAHEGKTTILPKPGRGQSPRSPASTFALLDAVSVVGEPSPALTRQWTEARRGLLRLAALGRLG